MTKILIIEDNDMLNQAYALMLRHHGYKVMTAFNGQQGLEIAKEFKPDIILLDYLMPIMDGKGFLEQFRPEAHTGVKIVLLTNLDDDTKIQEAFDLGIDSYLLKATFAPEQLTEHIAELVKP